MSEETTFGKLVKLTPILPVAYFRTIVINRFILNSDVKYTGLLAHFGNENRSGNSVGSRQLFGIYYD